MDPLVQQARELHRRAKEHLGLSQQFRRQRDRIIKLVYAEGNTSYASLAKQIDCSPELVAKVVQGRC